jgi:antitoxin component YwqK of YwqJK toxin-antitoxin module
MANLKRQTLTIIQTGKVFITVLLISISSLAVGQTQIDSTLNFNFQVKDTCCESRTKLNSEFEQYYVLNFTDTVYVKNFKVISKCIDGIVHISNPAKYCQLLSFGQPITGYYSENGYYTDSTKFWYSGTLQNGHYHNGEYVRFYSTNKPSVSGQYVNGWKSGLWIIYSEDGKVTSINRFIEGCEYPVTEWDFNENGGLENYYDEFPEMIKRLEIEKKN